MSTISKAKRPRTTSTKTRNGRVRLGIYATKTLVEMAEKATTKKMKHKIENRIKYNISRGV